MTRNVPGIDISFWQASNQRYPPVIPWDASMARGRGVRVVYIKVSQTQDEDPEWRRNYVNAGREQMKRGLYHFFTAQAIGYAQARYFLALTAGMRGELPVAVDVEWPCSAGELWNFCQFVRQELNYWPLIYVSPYAWNSLVKDTGATQYKQRFYTCPLWQAQWPYADIDDGRTVVSLTPLRPWKDHSITPVIHQYSTLQGWGDEYGSKGGENIDLDLIDDRWLAQFPQPGNPPPPPPEPEPEPDPEPEPTGRVRVTAAVGVNVRTGPQAIPATLIGAVKKNTVFEKAGPVEGDWQPVVTYVWRPNVEDV